MVLHQYLYMGKLKLLGYAHLVGALELRKYTQEKVLNLYVTKHFKGVLRLKKLK